MATAQDNVADSGYDVVFVDTVADDLIVCSICQLVLRQPRQIGSCGHKFCLACLEDYGNHCLDRGIDFQCPLDRSEINLDKVFPDLAIERYILSLSVFCPNREKGCAWIGELRNMEKHTTEECEVLRIQCTNLCGELISPKQLEKHVNEICSHRLIDCQFKDIGCTHKVMACKIEDDPHKHLKMVQQRCTEKITEMQDHYESQLSNLQESLEEQIVELTDKIHSLQEQVKTHRTHNNGGSIVFRWAMSDVNMWMAEECISPTFSLQVPGYRLRLEVSMGGKATGKGSHMSVFMRLVNGDYDYTLQWPCRETFSVCLKAPDGSDLQDIVREVSFVSGATCAQGPGEVVGTKACGYPQFASQETMRDYIQKNEIRLECWRKD